MPKFETLDRVARALGVPREAILAVKPKGRKGEAWHEDLLAAYEGLDDDGKATLIALAQTLLNKKRR